MIKFSNVNLFDTMRQIVDRNTISYKTDLNYDIEIIQKNPDCDVWWWMSRECGTQIDKENDLLFVERHSSLKYFMDASCYPLMYMIQIKSRENEVIADIYYLTLDEAIALLREYNVHSYEMYHYQDETVLTKKEKKELTFYEHQQIGNLQAITDHPYDNSLYQYNLQQLAIKRMKSKESDLKKHLKCLDK